MAEYNNKLIIIGSILVFALLLTVGLKGQSVTGAAVAGQTSVARSLFGSNSDTASDTRSTATTAGTNWMAIETAMDANIAEYAVDMERCRGIPVCESIAKRELDQRNEQINAYFTLSLISGEPVDIERALSTAGIGYLEPDFEYTSTSAVAASDPGYVGTKPGCECWKKETYEDDPKVYSASAAIFCKTDKNTPCFDDTSCQNVCQSWCGGSSQKGTCSWTCKANVCK